MPSGRTHDAITLLLAAPAAAVSYSGTTNVVTAVVVTLSFLFGGLMFGPDLDTVSKQHPRWGIFRFIWTPYRLFFKHRSRWSHGLVFGTLIRVVYFMGVVTMLTFVAAYLLATYSGGDLPRLGEFMSAWRTIGEAVRFHLGEFAMPASFVGMWLGAASHTMTDLAGSYIKTGRVTEFL